MAETQIVIRVDQDVLRQFRALCLLKHTTPTAEVRRYIANAVTTEPISIRTAPPHG